jgi:hypothetical protein
VTEDAASFPPVWPINISMHDSQNGFDVPRIERGIGFYKQIFDIH